MTETDLFEDDEELNKDDFNEDLDEDFTDEL